MPPPRSAQPVTMTDRQRDAAVSALPVALRLARRYVRRLGRPDLADDFASVAAEAVWRAALAYDAAAYPDCRFDSYAHARVIWALRDAHRASRRGKRRAVGSFDSPDGDTEVSDSAPPVGWEVEAEDAVYGLLTGLPPNCQRVMVRAYLYADGGSVRRTARALGMAHSYVGLVHRRALGLIRERLEARGKGEVL